MKMSDCIWQHQKYAINLSINPSLKKSECEYYRRFFNTSNHLWRKLKSMDIKKHKESCEPNAYTMNAYFFKFETI